jgi:alpha-L-fucosidase
MLLPPAPQEPPAQVQPAAAKVNVTTNKKDDALPEWHRKAMETREQRLGWWREARFGMFIHWGVYSDLAGEWEGKALGGYAEHIQRMAKIPIPVYREKVAGKFNPTHFDADTWVRLAKEAGMGYLIITAKHHDGFAMYPSQVSKYNIVDATPFKRDPMRELQAACKKYGVRFGFYYSHAFDWGDADGPGNDWEYQNPGGDKGLHGGREWWKVSPQSLPQVRRYVDTKSIPQIQELIRLYHPDILWFDTPHKLPPVENLRILQAVREAGPEVVVNGRLVRGMGDYENTADRPAEFTPHAGDWEGIPTTNESYGYSKTDHSHKPASHFIQLVAKAAARGGNLLMNIGPRGDGTFDPKDVEILEGIEKWMTVNHSSVRGTERTPLPVQSWGESTRRGNTLYLHVFDWPRDGKLVVGGLKASVKRAYLLTDAKQTPLATERINALDIRLTVPTTAPDAVDTVVVVETENTEIATDATTRLLDPATPNLLRVFDGQLHGKGLRFGAGKVVDAYATGWSDPAEYITWPVRLNDAASYDVTITYDADAASAGSAFTVSIAGQTLKGTVEEGKIRTMALGRVQLEPGTHEFRVLPTQIKGTDLMRLRSLKLMPVASGR